jgi:hypothetical protein
VYRSHREPLPPRAAPSRTRRNFLTLSRERGQNGRRGVARRRTRFHVCEINSVLV